MGTEHINTVVIGAGHAGLAMSYLLSQQGRPHIVLEQGRIAERWRSERWDSLMFQFPNWSLQLPGHGYDGNDSDAYATCADYIRFVEDYAEKIAAPVRLGEKVVALRGHDGAERLEVVTATTHFLARNVIIATGSFHTPRVPPFAAALPPAIAQITARDYRNPAQLPPGAVLVVGSGASGAQIAEDLWRAGRKTYLAVSRYHRSPRRYRGRDFCWWFDVLGYWHTPIAQLPPGTANLRFVVTGVDGGHDIDLRQFAADGIILLGRLQAVDQHRLHFADNLNPALAAADTWYDEFKDLMDNYITTHDPNLFSASDETAAPARVTTPLPVIQELDTRTAGIAAIVWAGGYDSDFSWIDLPVLDATGTPIHERGVSAHPGVYFLGLRRTYAIGSALVAGVGNDAAHLAAHLAAAD